MNSDSHFSIGKSHIVCEDYACSGTKTILGSPLYYAIVSDGCSSSEHTDFGSRILTASAVKQISHFGEDSFYKSVINNANDVINDLKVSTRSLDATLNIVAVFNNTIKIACYGDGAAVILYEDKIDILEFVYPSGAPLYLSYLLDKERYESYVETYGVEKDLIVNGESKEAGNPVWNESSFWNKSAPFTFERDLNDGAKIKAVFVLSDGLQSFKQKVITDTHLLSKSITTKEVVDELFAIKGFQGEFIKRRYNGFIKNFCKKNDWNHFDDLSIAGIVL